MTEEQFQKLIEAIGAIGYTEPQYNSMGHLDKISRHLKDISSSLAAIAYHYING